MTISGRHLRPGASIIVNGRRVAGTISTNPEEETVEIALDTLPPIGMHFLQVQNPHGLFSNDFIFHVAQDEEGADSLRRSLDPEALKDSLAAAISRGDLDETKRLISAGAPLNERRSEDGMTPLSTAAFHGQLEIAEFLLEKKARIAHDNRDGNTPLHIASFLCRREIVEFLLEKGAPITKRNDRRETPIDVVAGDWNDGLAGFYRAISDGARLGLDLKDIERQRPQMAEFLRKHPAESRGK